MGGKWGSGSNFQCKQCGKEFYRTKSYIDRGHQVQFCSGECKARSQSAGTYIRRTSKMGPERTGQEFTCMACGEAFYRRPSFIKRGITKTCGKRECISVSMQKENNPFWGKDHSPEVRAALSEARTARSSPRPRHTAMVDRQKSSEGRQAASERMKRRWAENRDAMLALFQTEQKPREEQRYRRNFTPWQRENWKADKCFWCDATDDLILDHIIPVMDEGTNIRENAQTLCQPCNIWKSVYVDRPAHLARLKLQGGSGS